MKFVKTVFIVLSAWFVGSFSFAAGGGGYVKDFDFSFEGPFGAYDQTQLQRGLKVYTEVCSSCHGLKYVPLRTLADKDGLGYSEDQVRAYAEYYEIFDPELDDYRAAVPADHFPAVVDAGAPDLSLMAKARAGFHGPYGTGISQLVNGMGGPEYIASLYEEFLQVKVQKVNWFCEDTLANTSSVEPKEIFQVHNWLFHQKQADPLPRASLKSNGKNLCFLPLHLYKNYPFLDNQDDLNRLVLLKVDGRIYVHMCS